MAGEPPSYEALLAENAALRARIIELEGGGTSAAAARGIDPYQAMSKRFKPHEMDPNAEDSFRRPAYSRRTK